MALKEFSGELDQAPALKPFDGELDDAARRPLPIEVTPSNAGGGRGTLGAPQTAEEAQQRVPAPRRGGVRSEVRPYGAGDERIVAPAPPKPGASVFDRATPQEPEQEWIGRTPAPPPEPAMSDEAMNMLSVAPAAQQRVADRARYFGAGAPELRPASVATELGGTLRESIDNPVGRGAVAGFSQLGQVGTGAVRAAADAVGATDVADFARRAGGDASTVSNAAMQGLQGNDDLVAKITSSIINSTPALALGTIGGPALRTLFAQSAAADYAETGNLAHAGIMGAAEALGERFGFSEQIRLLKGVIARMPADDAAKVLGSLIAKEIPGEQATTAMQFLADKVGPGARAPNATFEDYLKQAGETLELTIGQTAVMGGGPAALTSARAQLARADAATERSAMNPAERAASDAGFLRPTEQRKATFDRLDDFAATHGVNPKAIKAIKERAQEMPLPEVPGFFKRALAALSKRGLIGRPVGEAELAALDEPAVGAQVEPEAPATTQAIEAPELVAEPPARTPIDDGAHQAATSPENDRAEPTEAQQQAGNYKMGRARIAGMDISIENPQGSVRRGTSPEGVPWETEMKSHYGYFRGTTAPDGDKLDVFVKPGTADDFAGTVFVVDQVDPKTGKFDEAKVMLGYADAAEAERAYRENYDANWQGFGAITPLPMGAFKAWATSKETRRPLGNLNAARTAGDGVAGPADARRGDGGQRLRPDAGRLAEDARAADEPGVRGQGADAVRPARGGGDDALSAPGARVIARVGRTPNAAQPIELRANPDGTLTPFMEGYEMLDQESGEPIVLPADVTDLAAKQAIRAAGAVSNKANFFPPKGEQAAAAPTQDARSGGVDGVTGDTGAGAAAPRTLDVDGRASDGKPIMPGDVFATASGRQTTPFPKQKGQKYVSQWLIDNAVAEAKARGDDFNATGFGGEKPMRDGFLPPASSDAIHEYLFGQQPAVPRPFLKPLNPASAAPASAAATTTKERTNGQEGLQDGRRQEEVAADVESQGAAGARGPKPAAPKPKTHPPLVMGSRVLAVLSKELNGLSPSLIADLSHRFETKRKGKNGKPLTQWRNPMVQGIGPLFRKGGSSDLTEIARVLEENDYLPKGSLDEDYLGARTKAQEIVQQALNRVEEKTGAEIQAEAEAAREAEAEAYYAELDAESAREAEAERAAIMAELALTEEDMASADDDAVIEGAGSTDKAGLMRALGFSEQEIADETAQEANQGAAQRGQEPAAEGAQAAEAGSAAAQPEGAAEGLTAPTTEGLAADAARSRAAEAADRKEQKRLADKAKADAEVGEFTLTGSDSARDVAAAAGQGDLLESPAEPTAETEVSSVSPRREKTGDEAKLVELRKRVSVLEALRKCLDE